MTLYALDSDTIRLFRDKHAKVEPRALAVTAPDRLATTVINVHEGLMGWHTYLMKAKSPADVEHGYRDLPKTVIGFTGLEILGYPVAAIARCESLVKLKLGVK